MKKILLVCLFMIISTSFYGQTGKGTSKTSNQMEKNPGKEIENSSDTVIDQSKATENKMAQQNRQTGDSIVKKTHKEVDQTGTDVKPTTGKTKTNKSSTKQSTKKSSTKSSSNKSSTNNQSNTTNKNSGKY